jgi:hypothetical protein
MATPIKPPVIHILSRARSPAETDYGEAGTQRESPPVRPAAASVDPPSPIGHEERDRQKDRQSHQRQTYIRHKMRAHH